MRRREAAELFSEICECVPEASVNSISLTSRSRFKEDFDLRIDMSIDPQTLAELESVVN
jgi:hypothetical protein